MEALGIIGALGVVGVVGVICFTLIGVVIGALYALHTSTGGGGKRSALRKALRQILEY